jgi:hypothetical protein
MNDFTFSFLKDFTFSKSLQQRCDLRMAGVTLGKCLAVDHPRRWNGLDYLGVADGQPETGQLWPAQPSMENR